MADRLERAIFGPSRGVFSALSASRALADEVRVAGIMASREECTTAGARNRGIPGICRDISAPRVEPDLQITGGLSAAQVSRRLQQHHAPLIIEMVGRSDQSPSWETALT
ncbi:MAG: hypothetical protein JWR80_8708 [Bradyrhizobium sp.]|nr:hypothetical protein [Bradyrhizobium sp.]